MAFVPLSFVFGAKNKGADAEMKKSRKSMQGLSADMEDVEKHSGGARKGFESIGNAARTMGKVVRAPFTMMGKMFDGIERRVGQFNLASIASDIKGLTGDTGNLSMQMDSAFASSAKAVKPMLAAIGKSDKDLKRLTAQAAGMAYGMNVSAEAVGKVMVELESAGGPAKKGLDALNMSTKDFVKFTEVSGIEVQNLSSLMGELSVWDMTAKQAAETADAVLAYGQAAGIGAEGLKQLEPLMEKMDNLLVDAPPEMQLTADQMQRLVISATKLSGAYREMGATQEQAMEFSQQTAELFVKESVAFQKALEGRGEYGEFAKSLMPLLETWQVNWQDFGKVLKTGALDSTKGMIQLNEIVQQASDKGFGPADVLMRQLLGTIQETSPAMAWLAQDVDAGQAALQKFDAMTVQSSGALKKLGQDGFSTGFTLQEAFDMARQSFEAHLRSIGRPEVRKYAKEQMVAYREMGDEIKNLGKDKTWGPMLKKLSILKQMGLRGVFMDVADTKEQRMEMAKTFVGLEAAAGAIEDISNAASPLMTTLGKFGPLGTMAGGLITWFSIPKKKRDKIWEDFKPIIDKMKTGISKIWNGEVDADGKMTGGISDKLSTWWAGFKPQLLEWVGQVWNFVVETAKKYGPPLLQAIWSGIKGIGGLLMDGISAAFSDPKIGLGASMLLAIKAGGIFGDKGALATMAVGSWVAAYEASEAAMKKLKEDRDADAKRLKENQENTAKKMRERIWGGTSEMAGGGWESDLGVTEADISKVGQTTDYAAAFMQDTQTQLALVSRQAVNTRKKAVQEYGIIGELIADMIESAQSAAIKESTGAFGEITGGEIVASFAPGMGEFAEQARGRMKGMGGLVGIAQTTEKGREQLGAYGEAGGGAYAGILEALPATLKDMVAAQQSAFGAVQKTVSGTQAYMVSQTGVMAEASEGLGTTAMLYMAKGIEDNQQFPTDAMYAAQVPLRDMVQTASPPKLGPLSEAEGNPLYNGGIGMMQLIAQGIEMGQADVEMAMSDALINSFQFAMGKYEEEAAKSLSASQIMAKVADTIVRNLTGIGTITLSTEEKKVLKASLDVPGMAGVSGAIIADGNLTRKVLERIATATEGMYDNMGGKAGKGKPLSVVLAAP